VCGQDNTPNLDRPEQTTEMFSDFVNFIYDTIDVINKKLQPKSSHHPYLSIKVLIFHARAKELSEMT
jgi:hypothetical protein